MKILGLAAIGQTPRTDYVPIISRQVGENVKIIEAGALDGLSNDEITRLSAKTNAHPVISSLRDGSSVVLSKPLIKSFLEKCLLKLQKAGADMAILMCTGEFANIEKPANLHVLMGKDIIDNCVRACAPAKSRLGVLVPLASQEQFSKNNYKSMGYETITAHASPYGPLEEIKNAAQAFRGCDVVVLHCMGYRKEHHDLVSDTSGAKTLCASSLIGHLCAELLA